jgi:hypothetical protein
VREKIDIPRHPDLGITITIVVDAGKTYHTNQKIVSDDLLKMARNDLEGLFAEHLKSMSHEMVEYLVDTGAIERPN